MSASTQRAVFSEERWRALSTLLDHVLELSPQDRGRWLDELAPREPELASDLRRLLPDLAAPTDSAGLLESSAVKRLGLTPHPGLAGMTCGPYLLDEMIGEGGMGTVWLAHRNDGQFEGRVAVKLLNTALLGTHAARRLAREGDMLARLSHPHIARLMDAGVTVAGVPYLVLDYVDGVRIDQYCNAGRLDVRARVALFLDVVAAVAHAHTHLVVHRDIKPTNVLVSTDGQVKLLDFGVATLLDSHTHDDTGATEAAPATGTRALTPQFAAPEQLQGGTITTRTDVYALGTLLYLLLTQKHPTGVEAGRVHEVMRAIVDSPPVPASVAAAATLPGADAHRRAAECNTTPQRLRQLLSGDLDRILGKALRTDPAQRYASAADLAEDLRRYLNHLPVLARPDTLLYQSGKFVRRHLVASMASAVALAAVFAGLLVAVVQADKAAEEARNARAVQSFLKDVFKTNSRNQRDSSKAHKAAPRDLIDLGAARVDSSLNSSPQVKSEVLDVLADMYSELSLYPEAMALWGRQLDLLRSLGQASTPAAVQALIGSGQAAHNLGDTARRDAQLDEAERVLAQLGDLDSRLRARLWGAQAARYAVTDKPRAADAAGRQVALYRASSDPYLGRALFIQARTLAAVNRVADAEQALQESIAQPRSAADPSRDQAQALTFLGELQLAQLKVAQAKSTLRNAVETADRNHGPEHTASVTARAAFGGAMALAGRTQECIAQSRAAWRALDALGALDSPVTAPNVLAPLGLCQVMRGRVEEGLAQLERAVAMRAQRYANSTALLSAQRDLAEALVQAGQPEQAAAVLERGDSIVVAAHPSAELLLRRSLTQARVQIARGRLDAAARTLDEASAAATAGNDPEPALAQPRSTQPFIAMLQAELAVQRADPAAAAQVAGARALLHQRELDTQLPLHMATLDLLEGRTLLAQGAAAAALPKLNSAVAARAELLGEQGPELARARGWLMRALLATGDTAHARGVAQQITAAWSDNNAPGPADAALAAEAAQLARSAL